MQRSMKVRRFRHALVAVIATSALAAGSMAPAVAADIPTYVNGFATDTTAQFTKIMPDDVGTLSWDSANQRASIVGSSVGQAFRTDSQSPVTLDGTVSVKLTVSAQYRAGVVYRGVDATNYSFAAIDSADTIRIREMIGGRFSDVIVGNPAHGATIPATISVSAGTHALSVTYRGDSIRVSLDGATVYDGNRPRLGAAPVAGRAGIAAWSNTDSQYDDLTSTPRDTYAYKNDFTSGLGGFTKISSTGSTSALTGSNGTARLSSTAAGGGDLLFREDTVQSRTNGHAAAKFTVASASAFRVGLGFRMADAGNYSWVAMESSSQVRIRETIAGATKDIILAPSGGDVAANINLGAGLHLLAVSYFGDDLAVTLDGAVVYSGKRPHVRASTGQPATLGRIGIVGWSIVDATIDDLSYAAEAPAAVLQKDAVASSSLSVEVDKAFPQVLGYTLTPGGQKLGGGAAEPRVIINDVSYASTATFSKTATNAARWVLTVPGVDPDGTGGLGARTVTLTYDLSVVGSVATTRLSAVSGDAETHRFAVRLSTPALSVSSGQTGATVAGARGGDETFTPVAASTSLSKPEMANAFAYTSGVVGAIYMPNSYSNPYTIAVGADGAGSTVGTISSPAFDWRFFNGMRSTRETALGTHTPQIPESRVYLGVDANADAKVDWQDGALWVKTQLPQLPTDVRDFFDGGNWSQVHGAFPGPGFNAGSNQGFTVPYTTLDQLTQIQREVKGLTDGIGRQSYEYVGWQGRGHDYGWPSFNEVPFNPAIGTDADMIAAKQQIDALGGDLSFHVNMTDMTDISPAYLRNTGASPFGNRSSSTGEIQYGSGVFGWNAYKMDSFADLESGAPANRQNAFVQRFYTPKFIYQDVMLAYPCCGRTVLDQNYAMAQEIDHWKVLGTTAATEYFQIQKYTAGGFLFKNNQSPGIIEGFLTAGNAILSGTRNYATPPVDFLWGTVYSDNVNTSNVNASITTNLNGGGNLASERLQRMTFLYSYLNGYLADKGILGYQDDAANNRWVTRWGGDTTFAIDKSSGAFTVTSAGLRIADGTDRFIPAYDGTNRVLLYSGGGSTKSWKLPAALASASSVDLYELTTEGRSFVQTLPVSAGSVNVAMAAGTGYVLTPTGGSRAVPNRDLVLGATMSASSSVSADYNGSTNLWSGREFATIPASQSPTGDWRNELKALNSVMVDANGNLRYEKAIIAAYAADSTASTYWSPNHESARGAVDLADGDAWLQATLPSARSISKVKVGEASTAANKVTSYKVQVLSGSTWVDVASGSAIPTGDITFAPTATTAVRLLIQGAAGTAPRIASLSAYTS
ncbi:discoidin domain-containing protein [Microbacterium hydrocarbonoxydans]|uniref:discoidin domain-containing protein n=1 Tax=Microbacterium hydrocarbonoxydans TaxID=273678 RepID=UPI00203D4C7D|nr:discoidin domain-containing protein [Microbacterium hydrocarbonoxydans]MCM3778242.1 endo-alpha-N-acetylgalactosaminidase family protein [Microbacterium hydrocarbonoxydans]